MSLHNDTLLHNDILLHRDVEIPQFIIDKAGEVNEKNGVITAGIVCPHHPVVWQSILKIAKMKLCKIKLIGNARTIKQLAKQFEYQIEQQDIVDCGEEDADAAKTAAYMAEQKQIDFIVKGHIHSDVLMRNIVAKKAGLRTDRRISHVFVMTFKNSRKMLMVTDAVVNIKPSEEIIRDIIYNSVEVAHSIGMDKPTKVAILSASEEVVEAIPSTVMAASIQNWGQKYMCEKAIIEGPFALDNAISIEAAEIKGIKRKIAGKADILVVPDIVSGNILFKSMVYFRGACALGCVLGAKVPVVLNSRADPTEAKIASVALAVIIAKRNR